MKYSTCDNSFFAKLWGFKDYHFVKIDKQRDIDLHWLKEVYLPNSIRY